MDPAVEELSRLIDQCWPPDRLHLGRRLGRVASSRRAARSESLRKLKGAIEASTERLRRRDATKWNPSYPDELPIAAKRREIAETISASQVVVVCGETGSGKSTQLPKICLELGRGKTGLIGHTQPRRIAARTLAARISEELRAPLGEIVGYKVRFTDSLRPQAWVKLMTDGILLAELRDDRLLRRYDTLIIDEAHERSLNIDFLLGYLKHILPQRPDLKLVITSATIDPDLFSRHFGGAPIIEVSGRSFPIEVRYAAPSRSDDEDVDVVRAVVSATEKALQEGKADVLAFLPGERDIHDAARLLRRSLEGRVEVLPLFARLPAAEQQRVFSATDKPRVVLSTNIAETSVTVPGIRCVIDSGYARVSRYVYHTKIQRLPIEKISQASADQRKGRCGRIAPGSCVRLYDKDDYLARPKFTEPEIKRASLASVMLQMEALAIGRVEFFPFLDPPDRRAVNDGRRTLEEIGAFSVEGKLTKVGRKIARLPVEPRLARVLLAAAEHECLADVLVIAGALVCGDPRERPLDKLAAADEMHARFADARSDFLTFLSLWRNLQEETAKLSHRALRAYCREHFLSMARLREWIETHRQLSRLLGVAQSGAAVEYASVHKALLTGLVANVGCLGEGGGYDGPRGTRFRLSRASGLSDHPPKWVVTAGVVETMRRYARLAARIEPKWVEQVAPHLLKRSYSDARWDRRSATVIASQSSSFYGLPVCSGRRVNYARVDGEGARDIFIRSALVDGDYDTDAGFLPHNQARAEEVGALEARVRRRDVLISPEAVHALYSAIVSSEVTDGASFERWRKKAEMEDPKVLFFEADALMGRRADEITESLFPSHLLVGATEVRLEYRLEPGHQADGITAVVPLVLLDQVDAGRFEWLVPGSLEEKLAELIRGLPAATRKRFSPAERFARACSDNLKPHAGGLLPALTEDLERMTGVRVRRSMWSMGRLPPHLVTNFRIVDEGGRALAEGRDLDELRRRHGETARQNFRALYAVAHERRDITRWDFADLEERVLIKQRDLSIYGYPTLVTEGTSLVLTVLPSPEGAREAMRQGLIRLFGLQTSEQIGDLRGRSTLGRVAGDCPSAGSAERVVDDWIDSSVEQTFLADGAFVRSSADFAARLERGRAHLVPLAEGLATTIEEVLRRHARLLGRLRVPPVAQTEAAGDVSGQLARLVYPGFIDQTPTRWLHEIPRYLQAVEQRLDKLEQGNPADSAAMEVAHSMWTRYRQWVDDPRAERSLRSCDRGDLETYRWMVEELRVSLFAQTLGTSVPVSAKRLDKLWARFTDD